MPAPTPAAPDPVVVRRPDPGLLLPPFNSSRPQLSGSRSPAGFSIPGRKTRPASADDEESATAGIDPDLLDSTRKLIEGTLGAEDLAKFDAAQTTADRAEILQRVADVQNLGPELAAATRDLDPELLDMLVASLSTIQAVGLEANDAFSEGLNNALTKPVYTGDNEDGSGGLTRTALFATFSILEAELYQAEQEEWSLPERRRIQNKLTRELIIAGMEAAGQEIDDTADVVFELPDGTEVRINEEGDRIRTEGT